MIEPVVIVFFCHTIAYGIFMQWHCIGVSLLYSDGHVSELKRKLLIEILNLRRKYTLQSITPRLILV